MQYRPLETPSNKVYRKKCSFERQLMMAYGRLYAIYLKNIMSLTSTFHVQRFKKELSKQKPTDKELSYRAASKIMDMPDFASIRDYYIKSYAAEYSTSSWIIESGKNSKDTNPNPTTLFGIIPELNAESCLNRLLNVAIFESTTENKKRFKEKVWEKYVNAFNDSSLTPYARVGALMRSLVEAADSFDCKDIRLSHLRMRRWMTEMLCSFCCDDLKKNPKEPAWGEPVSQTLGNAMTILQNECHGMPLSLAFPRIFSDSERSVTYRNGMGGEPYPKSADEFRFDAEKRHKILENLSPGQQLIFTPWLENGFQVNGFSWRNFKNYLHRHYVMHATEDTFDKSFFCEWVAFDGRHWSNPAYKEKYESLWDAAYIEWVEIAKKVVHDSPRYITKVRLSSLPPSLRQELAIEAVKRWPALATSQETLQLIEPDRLVDPELTHLLSRNQKVIDTRDTLGFLNKSSDRFQHGAERFCDGPVNWSILEHVAIRDSAKVISESVDLPDSLSNVDLSSLS